MSSDQESALYEAREGVVTQAEKTMSSQLWIYGLAGVAIAAAVALWPAGKAGATDPLEALGMCQAALKKISKDPEKADIPYVPNMGSGQEFYFAWGGQTKMVRMRNGLGIEVAGSASCIVDGKSGRIVSLTLNGKTIL